MEPPTQPQPPALPGSQPVAKAERIASLDIARGIALFGILLINITSFALVFAAAENPFYARELSSPDFAAWWFNHIFVEGKAISVFGMLFGAGIILSTQKKDDVKLPVAAHFYRRYGILAGIGLLHAYFVWFGDILFPYALAAFLVFLLRKFSPKILFPLGAISVTGAVALYSVFYCFEVPEFDNYSWPDPQEIAYETSTVRGPWAGWFARNAYIAATMHFGAMPLGLGAFCAGLMLMGMSLQKTGFFAGKWSLRSYLLMAILSLLFGFLMTATPEQVRLTSHYELPYLRVFLGQLAPTITALGYLSLLVFLLHWNKIARVLAVFAPVGRMALTLYLMQSVICGFVFCGYGLGRFETMGRASLWLFCLVLYIFQIAFAHWWLKSHRFGPLEWAWRRLSYGPLR